MKARVNNITVTAPGYNEAPVMIELELFDVNHDMLNNIYNNMRCYIYDDNRDRKGLRISSGNAKEH